MIKRFIRYILTICCTALCLGTNAQDGTTAYNFLKITTSTHAYGLGGTNISINDDDINL